METCRTNVHLLMSTNTPINDRRWKRKNDTIDTIDGLILDNYCDFQFTALEKNEQFEGILLPKEHEINYRWNRARLERRVILYRPVVRRIFDYWYREFRFVSRLI